LRFGRCALGVSTDPTRPDAGLTTSAGLAVAFTGVLDNRSELAAEFGLVGPDAAPATAADVILTAFRLLGEKAPNRLRGAFAAVVTDGRHAWAVRDHIGFGTLFYRVASTGFCAASEAKQVAA